MRPIQSVLKPGDTGIAVSNLQSTLLLLLSKGAFNTVPSTSAPELDTLAERLRVEAVSQVFGSATQSLVRVLQIQEGLGAERHGVVDAATAEKLNVLLGRLGGAGEVAKQAQAATLPGGGGYETVGTVLDGEGKAVAGVKVVLYEQDVDLSHPTELGTCLTDVSGAYRISFAEAQFIRGDVGLGPVEPLAGVVAKSPARRMVKSGPDLWVGAYSDKGELLVKSDTIFNAPASSTINLTLPAAPQATASELEEVAGLVAPRLGGVAIESLSDAQVDFLARDTGRPAEQIRALASAVRAHKDALALAARHAEPWPKELADDLLALAYTYSRQAPGATVEALLAEKPEAIADMLGRAWASRRIPARMLPNKDALIAAMVHLAAVAQLEPAPEGKPARLGDYLALVTGGKDDSRVGLGKKKADISEQLVSLDIMAKDAPTKLEALVQDKVVAERLFSALRLGRLTGDHLPLVKALHETVAKSPVQGPPEAALVGLGPIDWMNLVAVHGMPVDKELEPLEYVEQLHAKVEEAAPVARLAHVLESGAFFSSALRPEAAVYEGLAKALRSRPDLDLLGKTTGQLAAELSLDEPTKRALGHLKQLKQVGARWQEAGVLLKRNITSPSTIVNLGAKGLAYHLKGEVSAARTEAIWSSAAGMAASTVGMRGMLAPYLNGPPSSVIASRASADVQKGIADNPSLTTLFGNLDQCGCDGRLSVLSPAAYLADLLTYVSGQGAARASLEQRRPDIFQLRLSCENSKAELPHIDLVNEILENAMVFPRRIPLAAGTDIVDPSTGAVAQPVRDALAATINEPLDSDLTVTTQPLLPWDVYGVTEWAVSDAYRQWSVTVESPYLGFAPYRDPGLALSDAEQASLVAALDQGSASPLMSMPSVLTAIQQSLALSGLPLAVTDAFAGRAGDFYAWHYWPLAIVVQGRIRARMVGGGVAIELSPGISGTPSISQLWPNIFGRSVLNDLAAGLFPHLLAEYCGITETPELTVQKQADDTWLYTRQANMLLGNRSPDIWIRGLCYQSREAGVDQLTAPLNRNPLAYEKLASAEAVYPWTLPYDANLQGTRYVTAAAGLPRTRWLAAGVASDAHIANQAILEETLGLGSREFDIIAGSVDGAVPLSPYWGYAQTADLEKLRKVGELLVRSRLTISELVKILESEVVNPGNRIRVGMPSDCNIDTASMIGLGADADLLAFADRLHRYVRLWRRLALPVGTLDRALLRAEPTLPMSADGLRGLAHLQASATLAQASLDQVLDWFEHGPGALAKALAMDSDEFEAAVLVLGAGGNPRGDYSPLESPWSLHQFLIDVSFARQQGQAWTDLAYAILHDGPKVSVLDWPAEQRYAWLAAWHARLAAPAPVPASALPAADEAGEMARWHRFGLTAPAKPATDWSVANPADPKQTLVGAAMDLLARTDVLAAQTGLPAATLGVMLQALGLSVEVNGRVQVLMHHLDTLLLWRDWLKTAQPLHATAVALSSELASEEAVTAQLLDLPLADTSKAAGIELLALLLASLPALDTPQVRSCLLCLLRLQKLARLNQGWRANPARLRWLQAGAASSTFAGLRPVEHLPFRASPSRPTSAYSFWKKTTMLMSLARISDKMTSVIEAYRDAGPDVASPAAHPRWSVLATAYRAASPEAVGVVATMLGDDGGSRRLDPQWLLDLCGALALIQKGGITAAQFQAMAAPVPDNATVAAANALLLRLGEDARAQQLRSVENRLREERRDRLVDYLLWLTGLPDANALYERYLIDTQMSACMPTTRLLQATGAVQLFVQRCSLNLEPATPPDTFDSTRWQWLGSYRVWEAARRVFLYPENWLLPEYRDDRSEIFRTFENSLRQSQASDQQAVEGFRAFLDELTVVGQIGVIGMVHDAEHHRLYLVGRTQAPPYRYYWRMAEPFGRVDDVPRWTAWSKIDLDINGDHIVPFVGNGELYLAWAIFKEIELGTVNAPYYEVQLAYSRLTATGWTPRRVNDGEPIRMTRNPSWDVRATHALRLLPFPQPASTLGALCLYRAEGDLEAPHYSNPNVLVVNPPDNRLGTEGTLWSLAIYASLYVRVAEDQRVIEDRDIARSTQLIGITSLLGHGFDFAQGRNDVPFKDDPGVNHCWTGFMGMNTPNARAGTVTVRIEKYGVPLQVTAEVQQPNKTVGGRLVGIDGLVVANVNFEITVSRSLLPSSFFAGFEEMQPIATCAIDIQEKAIWAPASGDVSSLHAPANSHWWANGYQSTGTPCGPFQEQPGNSLFFLDAPAPNYDYRKAWYAEQVDLSTGARRRALLTPPSEATPFADFLPASYNESSSYRVAARSDPADLVRTDWEESPKNECFGMDAFAELLHPQTSAPDPRLNPLVAFDTHLPNACYNWEVFFHAPLFAAITLSRQHHFEDARRWFHLIFDPTSHEPGQGRERFWRFLPFRHSEVSATVEDWLRWAVDPSSQVASEAQEQISQWMSDPFNPFALARLRSSAFEWFTVLAYVRNLIGWADRLFSRDTRESVAEATLIYVLASEILGPRPRQLGFRNSPVVAADRRRRASLSYRELESLGPGHIGDHTFGNAWIGQAEDPSVAAKVSSLLGLGRAPGASARKDRDQVVAQLGSTGSLYFCVPPNDKLSELWDTVETRLFNIRHCLNIAGVARPLPLYEPPIDPELLIRARAQGIDLADALDDRFAPFGPYRFQMLLQKANEFCNEVKGLGASLLSAIEKKEGDHLALLRSHQEIEMLKLVETIKVKQVDEADKNLKALEQSRNNVLTRFQYIQSQLGNTALALDSSGVPIVEQRYLSSVQDASAPEDLKSLALSQFEVDEVTHLTNSKNFSLVAAFFKIIGSGLRATAAGFSWNDIVAKALNFTGQAAVDTGDFFSMFAAFESAQERISSLAASWQRRRDDWVHQSNLAADEIRQIDKQSLALQIRKDIADKELDNHRKQMEFSSNVDDYMRHLKFGGEALYAWMETELAGVYFTAYQTAVDLAKRAERGLRHELGDESLAFVDAGQWDSLRKGLMAGERLSQSLRRMEATFLQTNTREYELTKHVSLRLLHPMAVLKLKTEGACEFELPEWLFDMDAPGHYMRRLKTVSLSIPCVVGPYVGIHCTVTLLKNQIRHNARLGSSYAPVTDDPRFTVRYGATESIVTSSGRDDSGLFETSLRDERYLPFEGAGAISCWRLELPITSAQFDLDTISDAILHLRYTSRNGGEELRKAAVDSVKPPTLGKTTHLSDWPVVLSCRTDFAAEWAVARSSGASLTVNLDAGLLPYWMRRLGLVIAKVSTITLPQDDPARRGFTEVQVWPASDSGAVPGSTELGPIAANTTDVLVKMEVGLVREPPH